jgi:hypothetical protein
VQLYANSGAEGLASMKKVLVIGYVWPQHPGSGARIPGLVRHLSEFGWEPVLLTKPLPEKPDLGCQIVETGYRDVLEPWLKRFGFGRSERVADQLDRRFGLPGKRSLRRALVYFVARRIREVLDYPDPERGWKPFAIEAASALLREGDIHALVSSSPPVTSHLVARELRTAYGVPWVADFPHLWSQNNSYPYSFLRRPIDRRLERKTLRQADALTTTSEPLAAKLGTLHRGKATYAISHGFDPTTVNVPPAPLTKTFSITYTGSFDPNLREPSRLFAGLRNLIAQEAVDRNDVDVRFYGPRLEWVADMIEQYGLSGVVTQYDPVPLSDSWDRQRESQVLLVPKWEDAKEPGIHSLKIFEYLAARRPVLAVGGHADVVDELLAETKAGAIAPTVEAAEEAIRELYKAKGQVSFRGDESIVDQYSHRGMAKRFCELLDHLAC